MFLNFRHNKPIIRKSSTDYRRLNETYTPRSHKQVSIIEKTDKPLTHIDSALEFKAYRQSNTSCKVLENFLNTLNDPTNDLIHGKKTQADELTGRDSIDTVDSIIHQNFNKANNRSHTFDKSNICLVDWDDTLLPSSILSRHGIKIETFKFDEEKFKKNTITVERLNGSAISCGNLIEQLEYLGPQVLDFLKKLNEVFDTVIIFTNADPGWVEASATSFYGKRIAQSILNETTVISAKEYFIKCIYAIAEHLDDARHSDRMKSPVISFNKEFDINEPRKHYSLIPKDIRDLLYEDGIYVGSVDKSIDVILKDEIFHSILTGAQERLLKSKNTTRKITGKITGKTSELSMDEQIITNIETLTKIILDPNILVHLWKKSAILLFFGNLGKIKHKYMTIRRFVSIGDSFHERNAILFLKNLVSIDEGNFTSLNTNLNKRLSKEEKKEIPIFKSVKLSDVRVGFALLQSQLSKIGNSIYPLCHGDVDVDIVLSLIE